MRGVRLRRERQLRAGARERQHWPRGSGASGAAYYSDRRRRCRREFYRRRLCGTWQRTRTRPIIFALCHPSTHAAANAADLILWTDGRALVATGSSFAPVTYKGLTYVIGHVNNAMLYPGLCLGAIVTRARSISDGMFAAAANAVSSLVAVRQAGASLLPQIDDLRSVSLTVAAAVAEAAEGRRTGARKTPRRRAAGARCNVGAGIPARLLAILMRPAALFLLLSVRIVAAQTQEPFTFPST